MLLHFWKKNSAVIVWTAGKWVGDLQARGHDLLEDAPTLRDVLKGPKPFLMRAYDPLHVT